MKVWRFRQQSHYPWAQATAEEFPFPPDFVIRQAETFARIANESTQLAAKSSVYATRQSRLSTAKQALSDLNSLIVTHPRISITNLQAFEKTIAELDAEIQITHSGNVLIRDNECFSCWEFNATLNLSTPLKFLVKNGEIDRDLSREPPAIGGSGEYGRWFKRLKTLREMGIDMDEPTSIRTTMPIARISPDSGEYLKFLIAIRAIVEMNDPISERYSALRDEIARPEWGKFSGHPGHYVDEICSRFFPTFLSTVPGLSAKTAAALWDVGLDTPAALDLASDKQLLAFIGVGPKLLGKLRARCAQVTTARAEPRFDLVERG